jgi:uncharacterized membrane protein YidH (DUF202 family)
MRLNSEQWMLRHNLRQPIYALLLAFIALGAVYAIVTPLFEISDELWHYPMVKTLADGNGLPVQDPANVQSWRQEGSQPPLYYLLMAAATFWINTDDLDEVRFLNPHTDNGLITADRNNNIAIHRADEMWRWHGAALAVRLIRFLSVLMGAVTVYFTWRLALELLPEQRGLALTAAAITAFTPMFVFISASVNNDNLAIALSAATLWLLVRWMKHPPEKLGWPHVALGLLLGAGALSKQSALGLWGLAGVVISLARLREQAGSGKQEGKASFSLLLLPFFLREMALIFGIAAIVAFWWYLRNWFLYGDWLGWNTFIAIVGARPQPATLLQLWGERVGFVQAYWGLFGGVSVPMPGWAYTVLNLAAGAAVIGLGIALLRALPPWTRAWEKGKRKKEGEASPSPHLPSSSFLAMALLIAWIGLLLWGLLRWTSLTWASQGRLIFPAISAISVLLAVGLFQLGRAFSILPIINLQSLLPASLALFLAALSAIVPFAVIAPHYAPPPTLTPAEIAAIPNRLDADFGGELTLLGYDLRTRSAQPGESVRLTLYWQAQIAMDRNWSIFVHVMDEQGVIVAQRDRYPGQGLLATTLMTPGQTWADEYVIPLPREIVAPGEARLAVGVYDLRDGVRLPLATGGDSVMLGALMLRQPAPGQLSANFGGEIALSNARVSARSLRAGDELEVTLDWAALRPMTTNYSISVRVRDEALNRWAAKDSWPQEGAAPTAGWLPGTSITDRYILTLDPNTPPGQYLLEVVVYDSATLKPLPLFNAEGYPTDAQALVLSRVRVTP